MPSRSGILIPQRTSTRSLSDSPNRRSPCSFPCIGGRRHLAEAAASESVALVDASTALGMHDIGGVRMDGGQTARNGLACAPGVPGTYEVSRCEDQKRVAQRFLPYPRPERVAKRARSQRPQTHADEVRKKVDQRE